MQVKKIVSSSLNYICVVLYVSRVRHRKSCETALNSGGLTTQTQEGGSLRMEL